MSAHLAEQDGAAPRVEEPEDIPAKSEDGVILRKLLKDLGHVEVELGRLAKKFRRIQAEVVRLKTED